MTKVAAGRLSDSVGRNVGEAFADLMITVSKVHSVTNQTTGRDKLALRINANLPRVKFGRTWCSEPYSP